MDQKTIYSKTGKGVLEIKNKSGKLSKDLTRVLTLIDGKCSVADLMSKAKMSEAEIGRSIKQLEDAGYVKEFASLSGGPVSGSARADTSYVDDLDFTSSLAPGKRIYQSGQTEMRAREEADRKKAEEEARTKREEEERKKKDAAERAAREEAARLAKVEAERKAKEAAALRAREEAERKARLQAEEMAKTTRDLSKVLEVERRALDETDRKKREEAERKEAEDAERRRKEEDERRRTQEEERRRREAEDSRKREEDERRRKEDEARRKQEEERKRKDEEERKRKEEEERRKREEEERRRKEEEERRKQEEERKRKEEEERRRREEEERRRREDEERRRREEEDRRRREEDERRRREDEERRRAEDERLRREEEERRRHATETAAPPDLPKIDLPPARDPASDFMAEFERQQEALKKQAEEEARRGFEAEQARLAVERAQREEDARLEAERRTAEEAEIRARMQREEEDRRARERKREEEYQRKIQAEEERQKKQLEEKQRAEQAKIESDRRAREEELARKRKATEEADRKRRELASLKRQGRVRSPVDRYKGVAIGLAILVAVSIGVVEIMPMGGYIPAIEKLASDHIKEPVTIQSMKVSALSGFDIALENVAIGATQDVKISKMRLSPQFGSLFGEEKVIRDIEVDSATAAEEVLRRLPAWLDAALADRRVQVGRLSIRGVKLEMREMQLPSLNVVIDLETGGTIARASVATADGKLSVQIVPRGGSADVSISGTNWVPPIGPQIEIADLSAKGVASTGSLDLTELEARLYGGVVKGDGRVSWNGAWRAEGDFEFARVDMAPLVGVFTKEARTSGEAQGAGRYSLQSGKLVSLFNTPRVDMTFFVKRGNLDGVDLVRALQAGRQGTQGGSTKFEELSGSLSIADGRYQYRNLRLAAGILTAGGNVDIAPDQDVAGRVSVELRSQAQQMRQNLNVTGTLRAIVLRP